MFPVTAALACEGFDHAMGALEQVVADNQKAPQTMTPTAQMTVEELRKESLNRSLTRLEQTVLQTYAQKQSQENYAVRIKSP